jgi:hypothetical protein
MKKPPPFLNVWLILHNALIVLACLFVPALAMATNIPPVADAGPDQTVYLGRLVELDGTGSYDPDGDPIRGWVWDFDSVPLGSGATLDGRFGPTPALDPDLLGQYDLSLWVSDGMAASPPDTVVITVIENQPPVPLLLADLLEGAAPLTVNFDASQSDDPEQGSLQFRWSFGDGGLPGTTAQVTHVYSEPVLYETVVIVTDDFGLTKADWVFITVQPPVPLPPSALLLGSGLIPLAWARRKKRLGK